MNLLRILLFFLVLTTLVPAGQAEAIPPPELVRIGSVFAQVLAFFFVFFSSALFLLRRKIGLFWSALRGRTIRVLVVASPFLVIAAAFAATVLYVKGQNKEVLAVSPAPRDAATVTEGVMTVAGMQLDIADPSLRIDPRDAAKLLGDKGHVFIDIREPVEFSTRHVPGFTNLRVGDLLAGEEYRKLDKSKTVVLLCEAGERGSAIAVFLKLRGYNAVYVDKGIRGWQEKKLKFVGNTKMYLPDFRNKYKNVTHEEAKALFEQDRAVLIDVRSTAEFSRGHITGAINIPLVNMPYKDLENVLERIPKDKSVVGIAYDRFGAYYCKILGYLMDKKDVRYRGTLHIQQQNQSL